MARENKLEKILKIEGPKLKALRDIKNKITEEEKLLAEKIKQVMEELGVKEYSTGLVLLTYTQVPQNLVDPRKVYRDENIKKKEFFDLVYIPKEDFGRFCKKLKLDLEKYTVKIEGYPRLDVEFVPNLGAIEEEKKNLYKKMGIKSYRKKGS